MTTTNTSPTTDETHTHIRAVARIGHALSDPTRARILLALRAGTRFPASLADELAVSRQSISNHLTCLRDCGLVTAEREGRHHAYRLAEPSLEHALTDLMVLARTLDPTCCDGQARCTC